MLALSGSILLTVGCASGAAPFAPVTSAASTAAVPLVIQGPSSLVIGSSGNYSVNNQLPAGTTITWAVSSSTGPTLIGSISGTGTYLSPAQVPANAVVTIAASSSSASLTPGTIQVSLSQPVPAISSATAVIPSGKSSYLLDVMGAGFGSTPVLLVNGSAVPTTQVSGSELTASLAVPAQLQISVEVQNTGSGSTFSGNIAVNIVSTAPSLTAAARLLDQSTFGPTDALISQVQQVGLSGFLDQQFAAPPTLLPAFAAVNPSYCGDVTSCIRYAWWGVALYGSDQLRQRVALALSEMWVVSSGEVSGFSIPQYLNVLSSDAFSNWYTLMQDVTLTPAMGGYLNMVNSLKPANGAIANQNFAREMMQLFSIGTSSLNQDGTLALDSSGNPIPNYTQAQVDGFARAYTGWTYPTYTGNGTPSLNWAPTFNLPMVAVDAYHDTNAKPLLNGVTLPAGQTAAQDLQGALKNLFNHPSLPPFVCKQLIQHLVTSNPSPAYVSRVAGVFIDDGSGVRGDMQAVIKAILLDPEARAGDTGTSDPGFGHLREPILWVAGSLRGMGATTAGVDLTTFTAADVWVGSMAEQPQSSPSVFNFFSPEYQLPGSAVPAPEFQLEQTASALTRLNVGNAIVFSDWSTYFDIDFAGYWGNLVATGPVPLLDELSRVFLHGQMSTQMRSSILTAISGVSNPTDQVRIAAYLVITSPQYKICR